ncbi:MAG: esterase/lipase [halophilic archaeon J07HX5]|jgi:Esterase/lipase|nr:MAG: esterase/lipase [halophilic archaeon J07HX5]
MSQSDERRAESPSPEAQELLSALEEAGAPDLATLSVEQARALLGDLFTPDGEPEPVESVTEQKIRAYGRDIRVRIYDPVPDATLPAVVYFHGGGWVCGNLDTHDSVARALAARGETVVVSVDYRKAPEHKFPAAVEDAHTATKWVAANAGDIGAGNGLAVAGESAGGNLAAVVAQLANDSALGAPAIDHQLLLYPVTNHSYDTTSYETNREGYFLTRRAMVWFWNHYLRDDALGADGQNPLASPLHGALAGLPPATVFTSGYDPLRDEGFQYVEALTEAGVDVEHTNYEGAIHDFANMVDLDGAPSLGEFSEQVLDDAAAALQAAFN